MKIKYISILLLAFFLLQNSTAISKNKKQNEVEKKQITLFDGSSTDAWRDTKSENFPEHGWKVENGILTVLAKTDEQDGGHDIITKKKFSNFVLELEVLLTEGANSGVKYFIVDSYPGKEGQFLGLEYQLIDNERHPDAKQGRNGNRKMAALYDILPTRADITVNPPGEWNKVKIVSKDKYVAHWINDKKAVEYTRKSDSFNELVNLSKYNKLENFGGQKKGHILLQGHGNEVSFRNIKITTW